MLRSGDKFLTPLCCISITCFHRQKLFSFPRIVCSSAHTHDIFFPFANFFHAHLLLSGLDDVLSWLEQLEQRPSRAVPRLTDTSDTSGVDCDMGEPRRRRPSKKTYKKKKTLEASNVGQFFGTGSTKIATKPSHFYRRICRKDVSLLTHGHHEILRFF